jgi:hypothetical protein
MWKDTTTYSQGDKVREPKYFTASSGSVKITITCGHIYYPDTWIMHAQPFGIDTRQLKASSVEEAKLEAIGIAKAEAMQVVMDVNSIQP